MKNELNPSRDALLKLYLVKHFAMDKNEWTDEDLVKHFLEEFGVDVKVENDLYLFKYNQLASKWDNPLTHVCRGTIMRYSQYNWSYVSRPFNKFFNLGEANFKYKIEEIFHQSNRKSIQLVEKVDGSLIQLWYDHAQLRWRASSSGTITPVQLHNSDTTLETLFWDLFPEAVYNIAPIFPKEMQHILKKDITSLNKEKTYIFELCTVHNMVVTDYGRPRLTLLGVRDTEVGDHEDVFNPFSEYKFERPETFTIPDTVKTREDLLFWGLDHLSKGDYGTIPEGFVILYKNQPIGKLKMPNYVQAHKSSDPLRWRKAAIEAILGGTYDDLQCFLSTVRKGEADKLHAELQEKFQGVFKAVEDIRSRSFEDRKEYALYVQKNEDIFSLFQGFFFAAKEEIRSGASAEDLFSQWTQKNIERLTRNLSKWFRKK
jgi:hypothetical protein